MDIPSVRFQPVPEQAQAAITSTQGHPRLIWPVRPKFNSMRCKELKDDQRNEEEYECECCILSLYNYIYIFLLPLLFFAIIIFAIIICHYYFTK